MTVSRLTLLAILAASLASASNDYSFQPVPLKQVAILDGFWLPRFETNRLVTVWADFRKSEETGRISNFARAGKLEPGPFKGIPFDDSDVYKIVEGAAYTLATHPDPTLDAYLDGLIVKIAAAQEPDGYLYTARTLGFTNGMTGKERWSNMGASHELYNVGHLYEAAAAHYAVTGKRTLLDVACKSADLIDKTSINMKRCPLLIRVRYFYTASNIYCPGIRFFFSNYYIEKGRFACAVRPDNSNYRTPGYREIYIFQHRIAVKRFTDAAEIDYLCS